MQEPKLRPQESLLRKKTRMASRIGRAAVVEAEEGRAAGSAMSETGELIRNLPRRRGNVHAVKGLRE